MTTASLPLERAPGSTAARRAGAVALLALAALAHHRTIATLWSTWMTNDTYSHGPLIPLVSAWLAWRERERARALPVRPETRGLLLVALACLMQVLGVRADVFALQGWSIPLLIAGGSLTFWGVARTRVLAFPIAFLAFMLTFPPIVVLQMSYALKNVATDLATQAASALGARFERHGMSLVFPSGELRIENPCSGLRSLIALVAMGALLARLTPGPPWRGLLLFVASLPVAILANAVRLAVVIVAADRGSVALAAGKVHDATGYLVYVLALGGLLGLRALLLRATKPRVAA